MKTLIANMETFLLKKIGLFAITLLMSLQFANAQVPQRFNYQGVARDASGNVMSSHMISLRISVLNGGATGTSVYQETHSVVTNQFGLFTLQIGGGTILSGTFAAVPWTIGNQWLKIEMDANGGSNYLDMGTTQLLSVPFAMVAGKIGGNMNLDDMGDVDVTTAASGQVLKFNGTSWIPGNDNGGSGGASYYQGTGISITGSNVINNTGDVNASDDITIITTANGDLSGIYPNPLVDGIQGKPISSTAPATGQVLKFDGTQWKPDVDNSGSGGTSYTAGTGISIAGTVISTSAMTGDVTGSLNANTLSKIQGKPVSALTPTVGQVLKYDGTQWTPGTDIQAAGGATYSAGTGISINGSNVISASNLGGDVTGTSTSNSISNLQGKPVVAGSPSSGQVLKYNGTQWVPSTDNVGGGATYTAGTGITINGSNAISVNALSGDVTGNPNATVVGKLQTVSVSGTLPTTGQVLKYNGTSWAPGTDNSGGAGTYTAGTGIDITGTVVSVQPMGGDVTGTLIANTVSKIQNYSVSNLAPTNGYVLKWNGTAWAPAPDATTGGSTNLWIQSGSNIYNFNGGNVGIGTTTPTSLFDVESSTATNVIAQFQNSNTANTSNTVNVLNSGNGYNLYINKTGQGEAVYIDKNNLGSGTSAMVVTNNGIGNSFESFATGTGYAGEFNGGTSSSGGLHSKTTGVQYAGLFDGGAVGNGVKGLVTGSGFAGYFSGKTKIDYNSTSSSNPHLAIYEQTVGDWARINYYSGGSSYFSTAGLVGATPATSKFSLSHSSTPDIITATGDGNVGIGTGTPTYRLHVYGDAAYAGSMGRMENNNSTNNNTMLDIWTLSSSVLINGAKSGIGYGVNIQKTGTLSSSAAIFGGNAGTNGEGLRGSAFGNGGYGVYGNAAGSGANSYYGVYGYGSGSAGADYGIYGVQGAGGNDWAGYFSGNVGYTGMLLSTSDNKLKQNVQNFNGALQQVMQMQPKTYEYKHEGDYAHMNLPQGEQVGLIAQDLEKIIPSLVQPATFSYVVKDDTRDGEEGAVITSQIDYKGVNYIGLIPVLIGAIQDQQKEIDELKSQISQLSK